jgi:hypothetical protein
LISSVGSILSSDGTRKAPAIGPDKDSDKRQRAAIESFGKRSGLALVGEFTDAAVSGADPIEARPGFAAFFRCSSANSALFLTICSRTLRKFKYPS